MGEDIHIPAQMYTHTQNRTLSQTHVCTGCQPLRGGLKQERGEVADPVLLS